MKAVRVSRGRRGSSVQARSAIVGVSSRWAAISAAGSSRQAARRGFRRRAGAATTTASVRRRKLKVTRCSRVGPSFATASLMLLRPVALVALEAVAWVALAQASHEAIAGRLGHDRGCRDSRAGRVSADDSLVHGRAGAERIAVDETKLRPLSHCAERPLEAGQVGGAKPDPVDLTRAGAGCVISRGRRPSPRRRDRRPRRRRGAAATCACAARGVRRTPARGRR